MSIQGLAQGCRLWQRNNHLYRDSCQPQAFETSTVQNPVGSIQNHPPGCVMRVQANVKPVQSNCSSLHVSSILDPTEQTLDQEQPIPKCVPDLSDVRIIAPSNPPSSGPDDNRRVIEESAHTRPQSTCLFWCGLVLSLNLHRCYTP